MTDNFKEYSQAVFLIGQGRVDWGADFAVITAYNSDGKSPVGDDVARRLGVAGAQAEAERLNQAAHLRLKADLLRLTKPRWLPEFLLPACSFLLDAPVAAVTGCSPDLVHREPGWAANIPLDEALRLGRLYRQDAIFWVSGGQLHLIACTPGFKPEPLGPWADRVRTVT